MLAPRALHEQTGSTIRTYYYRAGQRVAMREGGVTTWLFGDHPSLRLRTSLGSTSVAYRASDGQTVRQGYYAWGGLRPGPGNALPTDYTFTGQKLDAQSGLMYYVARWYDPQVGRFLSADSIVPEPGEPQDLNRFTYVRNNPLGFIDPTGRVLDYGLGGGADARWVEKWRRANGLNAVGGELVYTGDFSFTDPLAALQGARQFAAQGKPMADIRSWSIEVGSVTVGIAQRGRESEWSRALGVFAMTMDVIDLASSGCYAIYSTGIDLSSAVAGPEGTVLTAASMEVGWKEISVFTNVTDILGVGATVANDILAGRTGLDLEEREAYIGVDSVVSFASLRGDTLGRLLPAPFGPYVTAVFSTAQVTYDVAQAGGLLPSYSLQVKW